MTLRSLQLPALALALAACGGKTEGGTDGSGPQTPTPTPTEIAPAPMVQPPAPTLHEVTYPAPPASTLPACSAASTGTCALLSLVENTAGDDGTTPDREAIDDTFVYWSVLTDMWRVPKSGGMAEHLGGPANSNFLNGFIVDATSIYWPWHDAIMRMPKNGGAPVALPDGLRDSTSVAVDAVYAYAADKNQGTIARVPIAGGAAAPVANGANCEKIAVDDANVYCRTRYSIIRFSKTNAPAANLAMTRFSFNMVLSDSKIIFDDDDNLKVVPVTGGAITTLNGGPAHFGGLAAHANVAYLVSHYNSIRRVPLDGSAITTIPLGGFSTAGTIHADSSGVYWTDRRWTCLRESVRDPDPAVYGDMGERICKAARNEIRVVRAPLTF